MYVACARREETEWKLVSERHPCPICGSAEDCHRDLEGQFVCCARRPSLWPLTSGAWLHRVESVEAEIEVNEVVIRPVPADRPSGHHQATLADVTQ